MEAFMKLYSTKEFAKKHGVSSSRVRQLLLQGRIYPAERLSSGWIIYPNAVVVPPFERMNRRPRQMD